MMTPEEKIHYNYKNNFPFYAEYAPLMIKDKRGQMIPLKLNEAQLHLHQQLQDQIRRTGKVRALVVKGRQQGASTYIGGRFFHRSVTSPGTSTFILSHIASTTSMLFNMVKNYYDRLPDAMKPELGASNGREFNFAGLGSDYYIGTANSPDVGRGGTLQCFHGSEVAFWKHTDEIDTGVLQSIADMAGTEIILESTANGPGNMFFVMVMDALKGKGEYIVVFLPWFWQKEYQATPPHDFKMTPDETKYANAYLLRYSQEAQNAKMFWRRNKIVSLKSDWKFKQEYPANVVEAFQTSGNSLVNSESIMDARQSTVKDLVAPLIMGVDPGRDGDRSVITLRRGREFIEYIPYETMRPMRLAGIIAKLIDSRGVDKCFIDVGMGYGTIDRLHELGYTKEVRGVSFAEKAMQPTMYRNKRSEILIEAAEWMHEGGVSIPDSDDVHADLMAVPAFEETSTGVKFIVPKDKIKEKYGRSPDIFDAFALTFAYPVASSFSKEAQRKRSKHRNTKRKSTLSSLRSGRR